MIVFWPDDLSLDFGKEVYGWEEGKVIVVAGLLSSSEDYHGKASVLGTLDETTPSIKNPGLEKEYDLSTFVLFRRPDARLMRFFALEALELESSSASASASAPQSRRTGGEVKAEIESLLPRRELVFGDCDVASVLDKINLSSEVYQSFSGRRQQQERSKHLPSSNTLKTRTTPTLQRANCLHSFWSFLKTVSSTAQQLDVRAQQLRMLLTTPLRQRLKHSTFDPAVTVQYIDYTNSMWLMLNDVIIGATLSRFLMDNCPLLGMLLHRVARRVTASWILQTLVWLDQWPLGLKLNTELSSFLRLTLSTLVSSWSVLFDLLTPRFWEAIILIVSFMGFGGLTMIFAISSDLLVLVSLHAYLAYYAVNTIYARLLSTLNSLWNLFRGKRHNVLRNRLDSWDYDIDELFLGTILFTLVVFLIPTFVMYYSLFALTRLATILLLAFIDLMLAFLNHFPLGALLLRFKNSDRLPGGVHIVPERNSKLPVPCFRLKNKPIGFDRIFHNHISLWSRLGAHYNPLRLLGHLLSGKRLRQISRSEMQYISIQS